EPHPIPPRTDFGRALRAAFQPTAEPLFHVEYAKLEPAILGSFGTEGHEPYGEVRRGENDIMMTFLFWVCALATGTALALETDDERQSPATTAAARVAIAAGGVVLAILGWRLVLVMARQLGKAIRGEDE